MKKNTKLIALLLSASLIGAVNVNACHAASKSLIPAIKSGLYYQLGGGEDVPLPAFYNTTALPLQAEGEVGLNFNCGVFNPLASIRNSLNQIKYSALNMEKQLLHDATGAITEFPLYEISRNDPNLYNLITNAMAGANENLRLSTKSCQVVQSQIASGQNPYAHWGQIALGNRWKQDIGTAALSGEGDINQARRDVSDDGGRSGVPWVDTGKDLSATLSTHHAGGLHQVPIHVIHDTVIAGFNAMQRGHRGAAELVNVFPTSKIAATWLNTVVGEQTITTYSSGPKSATPGMGLYADVAKLSDTYSQQLAQLILKQSRIKPADLQTMSQAGVAITPAIIHAIARQPSVLRTIMLHKLAQNIAALAVMNKARLATRLLRVGSQVPVIAANKAALTRIHQAIMSLHQDVAGMLTFIKARQALMTKLLLTLSQAAQAKQSQALVFEQSAKQAVMQQGAIKR